MATLRPKSELSYWARRALENEKAAQEIAEAASERIRQLYENQYKRTVLMMERLYAEVKDGKIPGRTELWNYARWKDLEKSLSAFVKGGSVIETERITKCLDSVFTHVIGAPIERFDARQFTAKIDPKTVINTAWSGENYSARVWKNRSALADRIRIDMEELVAGTRSLPEMRRQLMKEFDVAYYQADRLIRTEASYVQNRAAVERYKGLGVERVEWITQESGSCKVCHERDGVIYMISSAPMIPAHPNCNCTYGPWTESDEALNDDADAAKTALEVQDAVETGVSVWYNDRIGGDLKAKEAYESALAKAQQASGISGKVMIPIVPKDIGEYKFDDSHANAERRHGVRREDALHFIANAKVRIERMDGRQVNYYSPEGGTYILPKQKKIRTAFWKAEFARDVMRMMKELKEDGW